MRLILAATLGIVLGGYFVQVIPADLFKKGVGGFAVAFAAYHLLKDAGLLKRLLPDRAGQAGETSGGSVAASLVIGALGGVATVLAHAGGMVWSIYYAGRTMEKRCFVSTLIVLFALSNLVKLVTYVQIDILSLQSTLIVLAMSPVVVLGSNLGNVLNRKISQALFRRVVLLLILAVGANLALA
jgi:uncharacterized membrane protein YfcA